MNDAIKKRDRALAAWGSRTADKYITKSGAEPSQTRNPITAAEKAWREHAETVHLFLRPYAKTPKGAAAIAALERIGVGIALTKGKFS